MSSFQTLIFEKRGRAAWITLNRPQVHNALNLEMRDELWTVLEAVEMDPETSIAVFRGAGSEAFCSGADLNDFGTAPSLLEARRGRNERDLWGRFAELRKPSIAVLNGFALGAGFELSLLCDLRLASETASFGLPEVNLGYLPSAGGSQTLARTVGLGRALPLVLSGKQISAKTAYESGLLYRVVGEAELEAAATEASDKLADLPSAGLYATRRAVREGADMTLAEGLALETRLGRSSTLQDSDPSH